MALTVLVSCKKDETEGPKTNYFCFKDKDYELDDAIIWHHGYWFALELNSPGLELLAGIPGVASEVSGKGNSIALGFFSPEASGEITEGDYQYHSMGGIPMTFSTSQVQIGIDIDNIFHYSDIEQVSGGMVNISEYEDGIKISFELLMHSGDTVVGNYVGRVWVWDYELEDWWKQ